MREIPSNRDNQQKSSRAITPLVSRGVGLKDPDNQITLPA